MKILTDTEIIMLARTVEFQYKLEQFDQNQLIAFKKTLQAVQKELFLDFDKMTEWQKSKSAALFDSVDKVIEGVKEKIVDETAKYAGDISSQSAEMHSKILSWGGTAQNVKDVMLAPTVMTTFWTKTPVGGNILKDWVDKSFDLELKQKIQNEIAKGLLKGETIEKMKKRFKTGFVGVEKHLDTLVRTYSHSAHIDAVKRVYEKNKHIVKQVRWIATFEGGYKGRGTCLRCAILNGKIFDLDSHPPCPLHPRCRCVLSPVVDDVGLGLGKDDFKTTSRPYKIWQDGKVTKGKMKILEAGKFSGSMKDFLDSAPDHVLKNMVGKSRFDMLKAGEIDFDDLLNPKTHETRLLPELKAFAIEKKAKMLADATKRAEAISLVKKEKRVADAHLNASMAKAAKETAEGIASSLETLPDKVSARMAVAKLESEKLAAKIAKDKAFSKAVSEGMAKAKLKKEHLAVVTSAAKDAVMTSVYDSALPVIEETIEAIKKAEFSEKVKLGMAKKKWKSAAMKDSASFMTSMIEQNVLKAADEAVEKVLEQIKKEEFSTKVKEGMAKKKLKATAMKASAQFMSDTLTQNIMIAADDAVGAVLEEIKKKEFSETVKLGMAKKKWKTQMLKASAEEQVKSMIMAVQQAADNALKEALEVVPKKLLSKHELADLHWVDFGKAENFKFDGAANHIGGAHYKEFFVDKNGDKWLFKPVKSSSDAFIAYGEEAAYKIGRIVDPDAIEVRVIELNGKVGSIQKWKTDLAEKYDFSGYTPKDLTKEELAQVQREHVIDWLISNHDGHTKQFIRGKSGKIWGIDKGQAYKHLGEDVLDIDYHPNSKYGEQEPFYNTIFRQAKAGKIVFDPNEILPYIEAIENTPDSVFEEAISKYVAGRFKFPSDKTVFMGKVLKRKNTLRAEFERYYGEALGDPTFKFGAEIKKPAKIIKSAHGIDDSVLDDARALGYQGKSLPFDGDAIEDQNALVFTEKHKEQTRTVVKMKVRPDAAKKIDALVEKLAVVESIAEDGPIAHPDDVFYSDILSAIKNIVYHKNDKNFNVAKLDKAVSHHPRLMEILKSSDPKAVDMASHYLDWIEKISDARTEGVMPDGIFEQFKFLPPKVEAPKIEKTAGFTVTKTNATLTKRVNKEGRLDVLKDDMNVSEVFYGESGSQYNIKFDDGTVIRYRPFSNNFYSIQGDLEVTIPHDATSGVVADSFEKLKQLGIDAQIASKANAEKMYLEKLAYIRRVEDELHRVDETVEWKELQKTFKKGKMTTEEQVEKLREFWKNRLGYDMTESKHYNPEGEYQLGFVDRNKKGGQRVQYRPDITPEILEKELSGYGLVHRVTGSVDLPELIDIVLNNNGAMVSTVEKMRLGIMPSGMSPLQDMRTGGANYFFTRIKNVDKYNPGSGTLVFKKNMLRRMDAISYNHDAYGETKGNYVRKHRQSSIDELKYASGNSSNETIFKTSVTMLDNIDYIVTNSYDREKVLESFKKRGITELPDGRKIEDVVVTDDNWHQRKK